MTGRHVRFLRFLVGPAGPALLGALLYLNTLPNGFVFDDKTAIQENVVVTEGRVREILSGPYYLGGTAWKVYRPLSVGSHAAVFRAAGSRPWASHLANVTCHAVVCALVVVVSRAFLPAGAALAAGLLFAVHPVHTEPVNYLVGRAELLAALGVLLAWRLVQMDRPLAAGAAYLLGLASKENAVGLPGFLLMLTIWARAGAGLDPACRRWRWAAYGPMLAAAVVYFLLRRWALGTLEPPAWTEYDNIAATAPAFDRILTATAALGRHLWLLVWPARLSADYSYHQIPLVTSPAEPMVWLTLLFVVLACGYAWRRRADRPEAGVGLLLFAVTYSPVSNVLFPIGTLVAERLLYVPSIGFCLFAVSVGRDAAQFRSRWAPVWVAALLAVGASRALVRNLDWRSDLTLFRSALAVTPHSSRVHVNYGVALMDERDNPGAEREFKAALAIYPKNATALANLGLVYLKAKQPAEAARVLQEAVAIKPKDSRAHNNLGIALHRLGRYDEALAALRSAASLDPHYAKPLDTMGMVFESMGRLDEAERAYRDALRIDADSAETWYGLGLLALSRREERTGREAFEAVLRLRPGDARARIGLGVLSAQRGDRAGAERWFLEVLRDQPDNREARANLDLLHAHR